MEILEHRRKKNTNFEKMVFQDTNCNVNINIQIDKVQFKHLKVYFRCFLFTSLKHLKLDQCLK